MATWWFYSPFSLTVSETIVVLVGSWLVYLATLAVYCVYSHPLSHIPSPRIAAVTFFYEFYLDVVRRGRFTFHLHDGYGPIVRVAPDKVHIHDPEYFDELYARSSSSSSTTGRRQKSPRFSGRFGFKAEAFSTWRHDVHWMRRAAINPFFSVQKVTNLQPVVRSTLTRLTQRLVEAAGSGSEVTISLAYTALTGDFISAYCFARSNNQVDSPEFRDTYEEALKELFTIGNACLHFPVIFKMIDICPPWLTQILNPVVMLIVNFCADREMDIRETRVGSKRVKVKVKRRLDERTPWWEERSGYMTGMSREGGIG